MALEFFGFEITKKKDKKTKEELQQSFILPENDDGSIIVGPSGSGHVSYGLNLEAAAKTEKELILKYREISLVSDIEPALNDIVNEAIVSNERQVPVSIVLDNINTSVSIKNKITEEFEEILRLLKFNNEGHELFKKWFIDGRIYFHMISDKIEGKSKKGIIEIKPVDSLNIKKVREIKTDRGPNGIEVITSVDEYFIYEQKTNLLAGVGAGAGNASVSTIRVNPDSIVYVHSGIIDKTGQIVYSNLHKSIKPLNQLKMVEDSVIIYRLSRAPERRIFYIDVGNLPKTKAEQYLKSIMDKYKNKMIYDATTGEVKDSKNHMSMMEDIWLPRREGGRGTEIQTLPAGQNLGELSDVDYFKNKLYKSLNVPSSRMDGDSTFNLGRATEITRDEVKFSKYVGRLRKRFSQVFHKILKTQLLLKGIITEQDWDEFKEDIQYDFLQDSFFAELKQNEIITGRVELAGNMSDMIGIYYSKEFVRKNILMQTEEEIKIIDKQIEDEKKAGELDDISNTDNDEDPPIDTPAPETPPPPPDSSTNDLEPEDPNNQGQQ